MKKIIITLLLIMSLIGLVYIYSNNDTVDTSNQNRKEEITSNIETTLTNEEESSPEDIQGNPFNESIPNGSPFPVASLDAGISISALKEAMDNYYLENYTEEEKKKSTTPIKSTDLKSLQNTLKSNKQLKKLKAQVEPVEIEIADQTVYVARIIIPFTFHEAEKLQANNDILILNEALAHLGNHLVMVTYFDKVNQTLTPMHLTNSLKPLFYNESVKE